MGIITLYIYISFLCFSRIIRYFKYLYIVTSLLDYEYLPILIIELVLHLFFIFFLIFFVRLSIKKERFNFILLCFYFLVFLYMLFHLSLVRYSIILMDIMPYQTTYSI